MINLMAVCAGIIAVVCLLVRGPHDELGGFMIGLNAVFVVINFIIVAKQIRRAEDAR